MTAPIELDELCHCTPLDSFGWPESDAHVRAEHDPECGVIGCDCEHFVSLEDVAIRQAMSR